jgi:superfamily II DNA or RNA helicase
MNKLILDSGLYAVRKSSIDSEKYEEIKTRLSTMVCGDTENNSEYKAKTFSIFRETGNWVLLPLYYGWDMFGKEDVNNIDEKPKATKRIKLLGTPRDYQEAIINAVIERINKDSKGGIIKAGCAAGKTFITIAIIAAMGYKNNLIIVPQDWMCDQWAKEIGKFMKDVRVGFLTRATKNYEQIIKANDICIAVVNSIAKNDEKYPWEIFRTVGLAFYDECHMYSSEINSRAMYKIPTMFKIGLTATPKKESDLDLLLPWYLGPIIYEHKASYSGATPIVNIINYMPPDKRFSKFICREGTTKGNHSAIMNNVFADDNRNILCISIAKWLAEQGRRILIIGSYKNHLKTLFDMAKKEGIDVGLYCNKKGKGGKELDTEALDEALNHQVIIGVKEMAGYGLNIPSLDATILVTTIKKLLRIEQIEGRFLRQAHTINPVFIYINNTHGYLRSHGNILQCYFQEKKYFLYYSKADDAVEFDIQKNIILAPKGKYGESKKELEYDFSSDSDEE